MPISDTVWNLITLSYGLSLGIAALEIVALCAFGAIVIRRRTTIRRQRRRRLGLETSTTASEAAETRCQDRGKAGGNAK